MIVKDIFDKKLDFPWYAPYEHQEGKMYLIIFNNDTNETVILQAARGIDTNAHYGMLFRCIMSNSQIYDVKPDIDYVITLSNFDKEVIEYENNET